ncbi:hypothetical protein GOP47_0016809 [Adiantum capillus-veneris]|uniref:Uncharacterized protein n=1 Tax=Adiantum capillus-veneris TaxID=13818 RepID=A0A9D4UIE1_ADICA|nr:hypothetical protein GOP47_0016809 [Adiantum capillus-veneris]
MACRLVETVKSCVAAEADCGIWAQSTANCVHEAYRIEEENQNNLRRVLALAAYAHDLVKSTKFGRVWTDQKESPKKNINELYLQTISATCAKENLAIAHDVGGIWACCRVGTSPARQGAPTEPNLDPFDAGPDHGPFPGLASLHTLDTFRFSSTSPWHRMQTHANPCKEA